MIMKKSLLLCIFLLSVILSPGQYHIELNVDQLPKLEADAGEGDTLCGLTANLKAMSVTQNGFWEQASGPGNSEFLPDEVTPELQVKVSEQGNYEFVWTEDNGICTERDTVDVAFYDVPEADAGSDQSIEQGESIRIGGDPAATGGNGDFTYTWSPEIDLDDPNASNPQASPTDTTDYILTIKDENQCSDSDTVTIYVIESTSVHGLSSEDVKIYPNPANDKLNIVFQEVMNDNYVIKLSDSQGVTRIIKEFSNIGQGKYTIDLSNIPPGVYFIQISNGQMSGSWKILIEN
jgi:hypothetical protein